jgi:PadR family transcriptional regulator PadR
LAGRPWRSRSPSYGAGPESALRTWSIHFTNRAIRFQLAKVRVTNLRSRIVFLARATVGKRAFHQRAPKAPRLVVSEGPVCLFTVQSQTLLLTAIVPLFYCVKQMPRGDLLGSLEHIVLLALIQLKSNAYGMTVRREIEERTGRNISIGAVYTTLERLQAKGYVSSLVGEPTAERGGRAKRLFRIEADGERALRASQEAIRKMTLGLARRWRTT